MEILRRCGGPGIRVFPRGYSLSRMGLSREDSLLVRRPKGIDQFALSFLCGSCREAGFGAAAE